MNVMEILIKTVVKIKNALLIKLLLVPVSTIIQPNVENAKTTLKPYKMENSTHSVWILAIEVVLLLMMVKLNSTEFTSK
jgi:hypothetical protein